MSKHFGRSGVEVVIKLDFRLKEPRSNLNLVTGKTLYPYSVTLQPAGVLELADLSSGYRPRTLIERGTTKSI